MLVAVIFIVLVHYGTEGCSSFPSLSLSLVSTPLMTGSALLCRLCVEQKTQHNYTFKWILYPGNLRGRREGERSALYPLDPTKKKNHGLWRCEVEEFLNISAEYYLGTPTPTSPTEKKSTNTEDILVLINRSPMKIILAVFLGVVLSFTLITIIIVISGCQLNGQCRKSSATHHRDKGKQGSENGPLTQNLCAERPNPDTERADNVSYVELDLFPKSPSGRPMNPRSTVYASIV
ncbi:uncharacterized protein WCC33_015458 [Rhinophrynus dorsalis]